MTLDVAPPLLTCTDVQVTYRNGGRGLRGISLVVKGGEHIAIIGESGCGKSTLVRAILGLLPAGTTISGSIQLDDGAEIAGAAERQLRDMRGRLVGYVPQNPAGSFDPLRSIGSQLAEAWECHGRRVDRAFLVGLLEQMGVAERPGAYWPPPVGMERRHAATGRDCGGYRASPAIGPGRRTDQRPGPATGAADAVHPGRKLRRERRGHP